jgi:competence protein ComEA
MLKKTSIILVKYCCLFSFTLLISAALILGAGVTQTFAAKKADTQKSIAGLVDINNATQKELEGIKGVGAATAKKIIASRPYKSVDELSKAGLSAKAVDSIKPFVTVGSAPAAPVATAAKTSAAAKAATASPEVTKSAQSAQTKAKSAATKLAPGTKININNADQSTIEKLPEIGPVKAKAIIDGRPYNSIEDIMKVKGIKGKTFDAIKDYIVVK